MIMVLILIGVVVGMMQCASKTMHKKKPHLQEDGRARMPAVYLAGFVEKAGVAGTGS